jgi:hypothetical protein
MSNVTHWARDQYWQEALEAFSKFKDSGENKIVLDLNAIQQVVYNGDGPAYKLMEAMVSVWEKEGMEGHRGAPRVMLGLLMRLKELSEKRTCP